MATEGFDGFYIETRNYGATAAFWISLGFESVFETDHGSGQFRHSTGGPYIFINERHEGDLETHPILKVGDATTFDPDRDPDWVQRFEPTHWNTVEAVVRDPDGREVSLQAPVPAGESAVDTDAHHTEKYG